MMSVHMLMSSPRELRHIVLGAGVFSKSVLAIADIKLSECLSVMLSKA